MAKIIIRNFGAIGEWSTELDNHNFCVLTGPQASGKSTIAKCIYYFRSAKEVICDAFSDYLEEGEAVYSYSNAKNFQNYVLSRLRARFMELFGTSKSMSKDLYLYYEYKDTDTYFKIRLKDVQFDADADPFENYIDIRLGNKLYSYLRTMTDKATNVKTIRKELDTLLEDPYEPYFITAGRCVLSLMASQLKYMFFKMDDRQKSRMDYATRKLIEYISELKEQMDEGLEGMVYSYIQEQDIRHLRANDRNPQSLISTFHELIALSKKIIKGTYKVVGGEERIYLHSDQEKFIKINYASSGQQEALWIINMLFYLAVSGKKAFVIIEEPESHLFPDAQRLITTFIAAISNLGCQVLLTTHSPYVLGTVNNLRYAAFLSDKSEICEQVQKIVPKYGMLDALSAFFVNVDPETGTATPVNCIDNSEAGLIDNDVIEGASEKIHDDYIDLFDLYFNMDEQNEGM